MSDSTCQGWANHQTWLANLAFVYDVPTQRVMQKLVHASKKHPKVLANKLREHAQKEFDTHDEFFGLYEQEDLDDVVWIELANVYIPKYDYVLMTKTKDKIIEER